MAFFRSPRYLSIDTSLGLCALPVGDKASLDIRPRGNVIRAGMLSEGVCYPRGCIIPRSVLSEGVCYPRGCVIRGCVLSEGVCYPRGCVIRGGVFSCVLPGTKYRVADNNCNNTLKQYKYDISRRR